MQAGERILIIEDNEDIVTFLADNILHPHGYDTLVALDGQEGLRRAVEDNPDLILLDLNLPRMTGLEILKALQKRGSGVPVILMTFYGSEEIAVDAFRLGVKNYIVKPFKSQEVLEAVESALGESRLRNEKKLLTEQLMQTNRQLEQRVRDLTMVYEITQAMTKLMDLETLLSRLVEAAVFLSNADEGILFLIDEDTGELYLRAAKGVGEKYARGLRLRVEDSLIGQVVRTKEPLRVTSPEDRLELKVKTGYLVSSLLYVPLRFREEIKGVLGVSNRVSDRPFTATDEHRLNILADHAMIALENSRLYEGEHRRASQLAMTTHLSHRIVSILDLEALLSEVVELLRANLGYYYSQILLRDGDGQLVVREGSGNLGESIQESQLRVAIDDQSIVGWAANHGEALCANDVRREARYQPLDLLSNTRSELAVPLRIGNQILGVLDIHSDQKNAFPQEDQAMLQMLADQIAVGIQNATCYERLQAPPGPAVLSRIFAAVSSATDLDQILFSTMDGIAALLDVAAGALLLVDESRGVLEFKASLPRSAVQAGLPGLNVGEGVAGWVAEHGEPLFVNEALENSRYGDEASFSGLQVHSILAVPLKVRGRTIGVIEVFNKGGVLGQGRFDDADLQMLAVLAAGVGPSLENERLLHSTPVQAGDAIRSTLASFADGVYQELKAFATATYALKARSRRGTLGPGDEVVAQLLGAMDLRIEQLASLGQLLNDLASSESTADDWANIDQRLQKLRAKYPS